MKNSPLWRYRYLLLFVCVCVFRIYWWCSVDITLLAIDIQAVARASTETRIAGGMFAGMITSLVYLVIPLLAVFPKTRKFVFPVAVFLLAFAVGGALGMLVVGYSATFVLSVYVTSFVIFLGYYFWSTKLARKKPEDSITP